MCSCRRCIFDMAGVSHHAESLSGRDGSHPTPTALLVRQHIEELLPPLRLWTRPLVLLNFGQYLFEASHVGYSPLRSAA